MKHIPIFFLFLFLLFICMILHAQESYFLLSSIQEDSPESKANHTNNENVNTENHDDLTPQKATKDLLKIFRVPNDEIDYLKKELKKKDDEINQLKQTNTQLREKLKEQDDALKIIAKNLKIDESRIDQLSINGLITDIRITLDDFRFYGKEILSSDDLIFFEDVCEDNPRLLKIILSYDSYIKNIIKHFQ